MMVTIPLGNHGVTVVDDEDADQAQFAWSFHGGYASRMIHSPMKDGKRTSRRVYLHREILGLKRGDKLCADHIDRNRLNNRRDNLRVVVDAENHQNLSSHRNSASRYRGVHRHGQRNKWRARVNVGPAGNSKIVFDKLFDDEDEAGAAVAEARRQHMPYAS